MSRATAPTLMCRGQQMVNDAGPSGPCWPPLTPQLPAGPRWPPLTPQVPASPRRPYSPSMPAFASLLWRPLLARASQASSLAHSPRLLHPVGLSVFLRQPLCSAQPSLFLPIQQPSLRCLCPSSVTAIAQRTLYFSFTCRIKLISPSRQSKWWWGKDLTTRR